MYEILDKINFPEDVKKLSESEVLQLNEEIRRFLVENVTKTGGHLASNLGVVELTVALHRVFNCPQDKIIFDVGHQSYVHKILTGRKDRFDTLRKAEGLSGFTKMSESIYDSFGAGHSSTSISAALGYAHASRLQNKDNYSIAVIGDGAFTGGLAFEALNNCRPDLKLIVILNENEMSISKNVGNLSDYISRLRSTRKYFRAKLIISKLFLKIPLLGGVLFKFAKKIKKMLKGAIYNLNIFENYGFDLLGPIDGNDYCSVEMILKEAKEKKKSVLVHIRTRKGCGYDNAVKHPEKYHVINPYRSGSPGKSNFSDEFGKYLCKVAEKDEKICAITASMPIGTGLVPFNEKYPERFFDVGIAEGHAMTFFAGLRAAGMKPVFAVYSTFLQRAYDNIIHDVSLQNLGGLITVDRAGFADGDGKTHHGIYDVAFLSEINNITLFSPIGYRSLENMVSYCLSNDGLFAIRYPKGRENEKILHLFYKNESDYCNFDIKKAYDDSGIFNTDILIITYGRIVSQAADAAEKLNGKGIKTGIILLETLKPADRQAKLINESIGNVKKIIFLEEGIYNGGAGMIFKDKLLRMGKIGCENFDIMAIDGEIPEQGELEYLYKKCGISADDILNNVGDAKCE